MPQEARWSHLQGCARRPSIGKDVDEAMDAITVLRFENDQVLNDTASVPEKIASHLASTPGRGAGVRVVSQ